MNNKTNFKLVIKPQWIFSSSFDFFDSNSKKIGSIEYPLLAKMLNSNKASILYNNFEYQLVDAAAALSLYTPSRFVNTYVLKGDDKILELSYKALKSSEEYIITDNESKKEYIIKLSGFGIWDIFLNTNKIGKLTNKEFILRRASVELNESIPELILFLIFWGSKNTQG
jgi:hypothetical protein